MREGAADKTAIQLVKGYIGKKLTEELLRRGLALMTRVRRNMKALPSSLLD